MGEIDAISAMDAVMANTPNHARMKPHTKTEGPPLMSPALKELCGISADVRRGMGKDLAEASHEEMMVQEKATTETVPKVRCSQIRPIASPGRRSRTFSCCFFPVRANVQVSQSSCVGADPSGLVGASFAPARLRNSTESAMFEAAMV